MQQFQGLIDWCASPADAGRPRVVSALVYGYDGTRVLGAWSGILTYWAGDLTRFDGRLAAISREPCDHDGVDVSIRVWPDSSVASIAAARWSVQVPLVDLSLRNGILEARCESDPRRRFSFFLQSELRPRDRPASSPTFRPASRLS